MVKNVTSELMITSLTIIKPKRERNRTNSTEASEGSISAL